MINLHLHTNYSDGIKTISIADHDCVDAYLFLKDINIKDYYTGTLIPGVEMKCNFHGYLIEVLGYLLILEY